MAMQYVRPVQKPPELRRAVGLWLLVFYGLGVTVGAGIFALIGEIVGLAGDHAPWAFLLAGLVAGFTGVTYAVLSSIFPRAAGEAFYVGMGFGARIARLVGLTMVGVGALSSAVIALAFTGYIGDLLPVSEAPLAIMLIAGLALIAWVGVRESVIFAAIITVVELGTLIVVAIFGIPTLLAPAATVAAAVPATEAANAFPALAIVSGALVAFFAFVGFEDMENLAEETIAPQRNIPRAILLTLAITVAIYVLLAMIAVSVPDRAGLVNADAPMRFIFESTSGMNGQAISMIAALAMINGVLVQIIMASRILFGMARDGLLPPWLAQLHRTRQTPTLAIGTVSGVIALLVLIFPLLALAQVASMITLAVFTLVNLALWVIGGRANAPPRLRRWRHWGLAAAIVCGLLMGGEFLRLGVAALTALSTG